MALFRDVHGNLYRIPAAALEEFKVEDGSSTTGRLAGLEVAQGEAEPSRAGYQWPPAVHPGYQWAGVSESQPAPAGVSRAAYHWPPAVHPGYRWSSEPELGAATVDDRPGSFEGVSERAV